MKDKILLWQLSGAFFTITLGTILHFLYDCLDAWKPAALFSSVNESVWEHLKIGFWPVLFFAIAEFFFLRKTTPNFYLAKAVNLLSIPLLIMFLFYTYSGILGYNLLFIDIIIFDLSVLAGYFASYRILTRDEFRFRKSNRRGSLILSGLLFIAFSTFTFYPPHIALFMDPLTGRYGIHNHHLDEFRTATFVLNTIR